MHLSSLVSEGRNLVYLISVVTSGRLRFLGPRPCQIFLDTVTILSTQGWEDSLFSEAHGSGGHWIVDFVPPY